MSKRKRPTHSEDELLEQWDFLDAMVDRQAAQLRAGIQDSEEVDEPTAAVDVVARAELDALGAKLESLRREHDALRAEHTALQAERTELLARVAAPPPAPAGVSPKVHERLRAEHEALRSEHDRLRSEHAAAAGEVQQLRHEVDRLRAVHVAAKIDQNAAAEADATRRRLAEVEAELQREQARRAELVESLRTAHGELESLRQQLTVAPPARRPWWKR